MTTKPAMSTEAIALTERKMDMSLDEIIKMSKKPSSKADTHRASIRSRGFLNNVASQGSAAKVQRFMDARSSLRQGVFAQRRSNFQGKNQFPLAREVARKAAVAPLRSRPINRNRMVNWSKPRVTTPVQRNTSENGFSGGRANVVPKQRPQTLDSLFANMKEQRMRVFSQQKQTNGGQNVRRRGAQQTNGGQNVRRQGAQQWQMRGGRGFRPAGVRPFGSFAK